MSKRSAKTAGLDDIHQQGPPKKKTINKYPDIRHWVLKSDPPYDLVWLRSQPDQTAEWTGIRNLEARNMLRNSVQLGDKCIFYMGSCSTPAALAVVSIVKAAYPDPTAIDPKSEYYDANAAKAVRDKVANKRKHEKTGKSDVLGEYSRESDHEETKKETGERQKGGHVNNRNSCPDGYKGDDGEVTFDENPWAAVDIKLEYELERPVTLKEMKEHAAQGGSANEKDKTEGGSQCGKRNNRLNRLEETKEKGEAPGQKGAENAKCDETGKGANENREHLQNMMLLRRGRLSVTPVTNSEWDYVLNLARTKRGTKA